MLQEKIKKTWKTFICCTLLVSAGPAQSEAHKLSGTLKMAGGTAHIPFMQEIGASLSSKNPDLSILVAGGGSGVGVQKLGAGLVDIANTGRPLSKEEKTRFDLVSHPIAYDAIVLVVHPSNPIANLNLSDAQKIFSGEIQNWEKWTGKKQNSDIHLYVRDESSGTQEVFLDRVLRKKKLARSANFTNSQGAMKMAVANDPNGIGFVSFGYLDSSVKALRFSGHKADLETIQERSYPLVRALYVNTKRRPSALVQAFVRNLKTPESSAMIQKWGLVPLNSTPKKANKSS